MTPHVHADLIKQWADGAKIEYFDGYCWRSVFSPTWGLGVKYRVKPERVILKSRRFIRKYRPMAGGFGYRIGICTPESLYAVQNNLDITWIDPVWIETEVLITNEKE